MHIIDNQSVKILSIYDPLLTNQDMLNQNRTIQELVNRVVASV